MNALRIQHHLLDVEEEHIAQQVNHHVQIVRQVTYVQMVMAVKLTVELAFMQMLTQMNVLNAQQDMLVQRVIVKWSALLVNIHIREAAHVLLALKVITAQDLTQPLLFVQMVITQLLELQNVLYVLQVLVVL